MLEFERTLTPVLICGSRPWGCQGEGNNYNWRKEEQLQSLNETELNNLIEKER